MSRVMKFGGSTLRNAEGFQSVAHYIDGKKESDLVIPVVSAPFGATDMTIEIYGMSVNERKLGLEQLKNRYEEVARSLTPDLSRQTMEKIETEMKRLNYCMDIGARDAAQGSGETHSCILLSAYLQLLGLPVEYFPGPDAGFLLDQRGNIDMERSRESLKDRITPCVNESKIPVIGGFIGRSTDDGQDGRYKLGTRNSTDEFAAAVADAMEADVIEIIKDVSGVFHVEPKFGDYGLVDRLSYGEAARITTRGSRVVHPNAIIIAQNAGIPIIVKDMESKGTVISEKSQTTSERPVAVLTAGRRPIVNILTGSVSKEEESEYRGLISLFEREHDIYTENMVADAGVISFTLPYNTDVDETIDMIREYLASHGYRPEISGEEVGTISATGDAMKYRSGSFIEILTPLRDLEISVRSAIQTDEKPTSPTITVLVDPDNLDRAVKALCKRLFLSV